MSDDGRELVLQLHQRALEQLRLAPPTERPSYPAIDLPAARPGSPFAEEWELFRREVSRLLSEGARGKYALVKAGQPITVWDTLRDAVRAAELLYGPEPALVQPVFPTIRPLSTGSYRRCRA
jgi:hypothetical protein